MRAMEYTPVQCRCVSSDSASRQEIVWTDRGPCLAHSDWGLRQAHQKHLTAAECAAEYWQAVAVHWFTVLDPVGDPELAIEAAWSEVETWHRFASYPHASEVEG